MDRVARWGKVWAVAACLGVAAVGARLWPVRESVMQAGLVDWVVPRLVWVAVAAAVVASIVVVAHAVWQRRRTRREAMARRIQEAVLSVVDHAGGHTIVRRWRGVVPRVVVVKLPGEFWEKQSDPDAVVMRVARAVGEQVPGSVRYRGSKRGRRIVVIPRVVDESGKEGRDDVRDRVRQVMVQTVPKAKRVSVKGWDEDDNPTRIVVTYEATPRISAPSIEEAILRVVGNSFPGRWRAQWDRENDTVTFQVRPGLPTLARRPRDLPRLDHVKLRYGVDENGAPHSWSWAKGHPPHGLVMGETGGGKTYCLRAMALDAIAQGVTVAGADPKRIELMGLRGLPGVEEIATSPQAIVDLLERMFAMMNERYELIEKRQAREGSFPPYLVVLDEFFILDMRVNQMWVNEGGKGKEHPMFGRLWELLALARSADIHFVIGIQRPDVNFMPGAARDNVKHRVSMRALSEDGAKMVWGDASIGRDVPDVPGRATAGRPGDAREVQIYLLPDPDLELRSERTPEELAELDEIFAGAADVAKPAAKNLAVAGLAEDEDAVAKSAEPAGTREAKDEPELDDGEAGGHTTVPAVQLVKVPAETVVCGDEVAIEGDLVRLTEVGVDPGDEDYVMLEWAEGTLSVPARESLNRVA